MAVEIRVARLGLVQVKPDGTVTRKSDATLKDMLRFETQERVLDNTTGDSAAPNSGNHPTIEEYLELEAADEFTLAYLDQNKIITQKVT